MCVVWRKASCRQAAGHGPALSCILDTCCSNSDHEGAQAAYMRCHSHAQLWDVHQGPGVRARSLLQHTRSSSALPPESCSPRTHAACAQRRAGQQACRRHSSGAEQVPKQGAGRQLPGRTQLPLSLAEPGPCSMIVICRIHGNQGDLKHETTLDARISPCKSDLQTFPNPRSLLTLVYAGEGCGARQGAGAAGGQGGPATGEAAPHSSGHVSGHVQGAGFHRQAAGLIVLGRLDLPQLVDRVQPGHAGCKPPCRLSHVEGS